MWMWPNKKRWTNSCLNLMEQTTKVIQQKCFWCYSIVTLGISLNFEPFWSSVSFNSLQMYHKILKSDYNECYHSSAVLVVHINWIACSHWLRKQSKFSLLDSSYVSLSSHSILASFSGAIDLCQKTEEKSFWPRLFGALRCRNIAMITSTSPACACSVTARSECVVSLFFIVCFSQTWS